jgi:ribosome assembly protein YihI (activator of Der GTPase)
MNQFYSEIDSLMANMGISKDGNDDGDLSMSQEEMQLNEAKFYRLFNKINQKRF